MGVYKPVWVIHDAKFSESHFDFVKTNLRKAMNVSKITPEMGQCVNVRLSVVQGRQHEEVQKALAAKPGSKQRLHKRNDFFNNGEFMLSGEDTQRIETFIRKNFEHYPDVHIPYTKKVFFRAANRADVFVKYFVNCTSKFCQNIMREHTSNHIYFVIYISGTQVKITQRCHCTKIHDEASTKCSSYSSEPIEIKKDTILYKHLFPNADVTTDMPHDYETSVSQTYGMSTDPEVNRSTIESAIAKLDSSTKTSRQTILNQVSRARASKKLRN